MEQKTLTTFFKDVGLFMSGDKKVEEMKKLTEEDRRFFAKRAEIEYDIQIVKQDGTPLLS